MKTRLTAIVLALFLCIGLLAGCQSSELHSISGASEDESAAASTSTENTTKDYTPCYETYDPDEVMLKVNGIDVTWAELFYWYAYEVNSMESSGSDITDWNAVSSADPNKTNSEYVMDTALDTIKQYCALESKATEMGITLTEEDRTELQSTWESNVKSYGNGDEETFIEYLQKKAYLSKDLYDHMNEITRLYQRVQDTMFGTNGEKLSDSEILEKAADMGYVRVKHIYVSTKDDTKETLPEEQLAEKKASLESLLTELKGISDTAQLETRFDELISQYSEDPGTEYYPDGYTFIPGEGTMDTAFETAAGNLEEYGLSDIVESSYGYHIILRLPLSTTATVEYSSESSKTTLGYYVAENMFGAETENWANESTVEYTDTYNNMDFAQVFEKATASSDSEES